MLGLLKPEYNSWGVREWNNEELDAVLIVGQDGMTAAEKHETLRVLRRLGKTDTRRVLWDVDCELLKRSDGPSGVLVYDFKVVDVVLTNYNTEVFSDQYYFPIPVDPSMYRPALPAGDRDLLTVFIGRESTYRGVASDLSELARFGRVVMVGSDERVRGVLSHTELHMTTSSMLRLLSRAKVGIVPGFKNFDDEDNVPVRILEYTSAGLPLVAREDSWAAREVTDLTYGNIDSLVKVVGDLIELGSNQYINLVNLHRDKSLIALNPDTLVSDRLLPILMGSDEVGGGRNGIDT